MAAEPRPLGASFLGNFQSARAETCGERRESMHYLHAPLVIKVDLVHHIRSGRHVLACDLQQSL